LLPPPPRPWWGGRVCTIPDRNCLAVIVFMARTSTPWRLLPAQELGCGSPATAWRRLNEWANAGVFERLHSEILDRLGLAGRLDWSRASVDSASLRAKRRSYRGQVVGGEEVVAQRLERCEYLAGDIALEFPESSSGGEALFAAVAGRVVGGVGVPAGPDDPQPGGGEDPDGVWVVLAAPAGVGVQPGGPG
jgi:transposase